VAVSCTNPISQLFTTDASGNPPSTSFTFVLGTVRPPARGTIRAQMTRPLTQPTHRVRRRWLNWPPGLPGPDGLAGDEMGVNITFGTDGQQHDHHVDNRPAADHHDDSRGRGHPSPKASLPQIWI